MPTAEITYPHGQYAVEGGKVELKIRYTGNPPNPQDMHIRTKHVGDSGYPDSSSNWDVDPVVAGNPGWTVHWPAGSAAGSFDFLVEWTWKNPDRRIERGGEGQYFVKKAGPLGDTWCSLLIAILMGIGGWVGGLAFGPSLIGYVIGLAAGFGIGVLICVLWHWANR